MLYQAQKVLEMQFCVEFIKCPEMRVSVMMMTAVVAAAIIMGIRL